MLFTFFCCFHLICVIIGEQQTLHRMKFVVRVYKQINARKILELPLISTQKFSLTTYLPIYLPTHYIYTYISSVGSLRESQLLRFNLNLNFMMIPYFNVENITFIFIFFREAFEFLLLFEFQLNWHTSVVVFVHCMYYNAWIWYMLDQIPIWFEWINENECFMNLLVFPDKKKENSVNVLKIKTKNSTILV